MQDRLIQYDSDRGKLDLFLILSLACCLVALPEVSEAGQEIAPSASAVASNETSVAIKADFAVGADYPLSKAKFNAYNSGFVGLQHYERDSALFDEVKPNSLRVDLWWGAEKWGAQPVEGTSNNVQYHFDEMDQMAELLNGHDILPYWSYCYVPPPLQSRPGDTRYFNGNTKLWGEILGTFARHARNGSPLTKIGYHEIYNEPDNRDFFRGTRDDYFGMYREGSRAIRAADPDALIGGPALAFTPAWAGPFLDTVVREQLPLDFFSFHFYPGCWKEWTVSDVVGQMRRELAKRPQLATTEMHLNEYNSYKIDYPRGGRQDRYALAAALLHDYEWFLTQPDLIQVHWAQFQDTAGGNWSGMISFGGHRKAVFNAATIYSRMPIDRRKVMIDGGDDIGGMASTDDYRAGLVVWNRSATNRNVRVILSHVPFDQAECCVYRIDAEHSSWGDNPSAETLTPIETFNSVSNNGVNWIGSLPKDGVIYFEFNNRIRSRPVPVNIAKIVRVLRYFPNRGSHSYADFDRHTWTARFGMGPESQAREQIGVVVEGLPDLLKVQVQFEGDMRKMDKNSLLGLRIDYEVGTNYTRGVLFHGACGANPDLYDAKRDAPMPWGTGREADEVVAVKNFARFDLPVKEHAPPNWTGRAEITFLLQNSGAETRAKISLTEPVQTSAAIRRPGEM